jgi:hypothetical protein
VERKENLLTMRAVIVTLRANDDFDRSSGAERSRKRLTRPEAWS